MFVCFHSQPRAHKFCFLSTEYTGTTNLKQSIFIVFGLYFFHNGNKLYVYDSLTGAHLGLGQRHL